MKLRVRRINPPTLAWVLAKIFITPPLLALIAALVIDRPKVVTQLETFYILAALVILYPMAGLIFGFVFGWIYNFLAKNGSGIEIEVDEIS
jgi:predicted histidine transporter YuiF (NhaC family)